MQFLSPWMLWGLTALAAPILIHFWQRRRAVVLPFSTLKYLRAVAAKTSRSARLENLLLLLLRCLIFGLLAGAAARPVISKKALGLLGGNVQRTVVLIIDRSGSRATATPTAPGSTWRASRRSRSSTACTRATRRRC